MSPSYNCQVPQSYVQCRTMWDLQVVGTCLVGSIPGSSIILLPLPNTTHTSTHLTSNVFESTLEICVSHDTSRCAYLHACCITCCSAFFFPRTLHSTSRSVAELWSYRSASPRPDVLAPSSNTYSTARITVCGLFWTCCLNQTLRL